MCQLSLSRFVVHTNQRRNADRKPAQLTSRETRAVSRGLAVLGRDQDEAAERRKACGGRASAGSAERAASALGLKQALNLPNRNWSKRNAYKKCLRHMTRIKALERHPCSEWTTWDNLGQLGGRPKALRSTRSSHSRFVPGKADPDFARAHDAPRMLKGTLLALQRHRNATRLNQPVAFSLALVLSFSLLEAAASDASIAECPSEPGSGLD